MSKFVVKAVKMGILSTSLATGLALANSYDIEDYAASLTTYQAPQATDAVSYRANGYPPFNDIATNLPEIPDSELAPTSTAQLTNVSASDIVTIVQNMRSRVNNTANAVGLHSGAVMFKNGSYQHRVVYNMDGANWNLLARTKNNMSWYPDSNHSLGMRLTTGDFNLGKMPLWGKARLDIPLANIKKEGTKVWFIARADYDADPVTTPLLGQKNYYEVFGIRAPILEFYGYYDMANGEWKIKFIINSDIVPDASAYGVIHPDLNFKVFAQGKALRK